MFGPLKNIIFDLDGTLISSLQTAIKGILESIEVGSGKAVDAQLLPLGRTPQMIIRDFVPEAHWDKALAHWENFELNIFENIQIFKGVEELLADLHSRGVFMAVYTGRDRLGTTRILEHKKWIPTYFDHDKLRCGDDPTGHKPSPLPIEDLCKKYSLNKSETLMVGDHPVDAMSAKAAGVSFGAVLWDLPASATPTQSFRGRYAESWKRWDGIDVQLRLSEPLSLREYFKTK
ncbi:MAG: HAD-IA family hydrolase [Bdellovibrionota bacterium]